MDVSCVTTVQVVLHNSPDISLAPNQCITVTSPTSLEDLQNQIRNKFAMEIPEGLLAVEIRAMTEVNPTFCSDGTDVAYAGEEYTGQDQINMRLRGVTNCSALAASTKMKVRAFDFYSLAATPAGSPLACDAVDPMVMSTEGLDLGMIRPTNILRPDIGFPSSVITFGEYDFPEPGGEVLLSAWGEPMATSCLAGGIGNYGVASCLYPASKPLCGLAGEVDMPVIFPEDTLDSIDQAIWNDFPVITFGMVVDTTTKKPIEGATLEIDPSRGKIVYVQLGPDAFDPITGDATNASGLFVAYMKEPSVVTVTQGASTKKMRMGGVTGWGSAVIVPLR